MKPIFARRRASDESQEMDPASEKPNRIKRKKTDAKSSKNNTSRIYLDPGLPKRRLAANKRWLGNGACVIRADVADRRMTTKEYAKKADKNNPPVLFSTDEIVDTFLRNMKEKGIKPVTHVEVVSVDKKNKHTVSKYVVDGTDKELYCNSYYYDFGDKAWVSQILPGDHYVFVNAERPEDVTVILAQLS